MTRKIPYFLLFLLTILAGCSSSETKESFIFGPTPGDKLSEEVDTE
jgi:hypothetical protein